MSSARRRIVAAAVECFAAKGYSATKVADIEQAAGLSVGAGGTYRHFDSKRAILEAVIDATVDVPDDNIAPPGDDIETIAHQMLDYMQADMLRIYLRDLDDFPEQRQRINERTIQTSYRAVAKRISASNPTIDADAASAVILGSLINFRINEALIGPDANGVTRDQFVQTWATIYRAILEGNDAQPS